ncbi:DUF393 domain-containing protein [Streptomyces sp. V4-01]|uniref:DUF393 domain-containing protein n=1 Tax=Actinacidiphila polyblastidii TaxID=3110430 RepID=A0ABU7P7G1_9ACTN|nr:DUF393 domain-containing protein [Streptomyces sp. V4-01]
MTAGAAPGVRPAGGGRPERTPLRGLTVLYDPDCRLCAFVGGWLRGQRQLVPIRLVPVGSAQARNWFPALDHDGATRREITVVGDAGQVYTGDAAWVVCLWALADHRALSHTLATAHGRRVARAAVLGAAKWREAQARKDAAAGGGWAQWQRADTTAGLPRHPVAPRAPDPAGPFAGRYSPTGAARQGPAPVWVYEGNGGWTQRLPAPPAAEGDATCTDGCAPPG